MSFRRDAIALGLALAAGCRSSWESVRREASFETGDAAPLRVAVLPFDDRSGGTSVLLYPFLPFIWLASAVTFQVPEAAPEPATGAELLRALLIARIQGSRLTVVDPRTVDTTLHHRGLGARASEVDPRELGRLLGVDAVITGELLDWSGNYYVVESRTIVEARVRLLSCVDGAELFRAEIGVSDAAGVSGGPTGYVSAAASPLAALARGPYRALAIDWAERMGAALAGETLEGAAVSGAEPPALAVAATTAMRAGGFVAGDVIEVLAIGTPGGTATFDLGTLRVRIPMSEIARVPRTGAPGGALVAHYRGAYTVEAGDRLERAPVLVTLRTDGGRAEIAAENGPITIAAGAGIDSAAVLGTSGSARD